MTEAPVAVVIAALNEASWIEGAVRSAWRAGAALVVVSDGGSEDATRSIAERSGAIVIAGGPPRGRQLNVGASSLPEGHTLCFLHADTTLPDDACREIRSAIARGKRYGGFALRFRERDVRLRIAEAMINLRSRTTGAIWGDQAQFFEASAFDALGGYKELPIMEDYELIRRARALGPPELIGTPVVTSGRRFLRRGLLRTTARNWITVVKFHAGVPAEQLAAEYRRQRS